MPNTHSTLTALFSDIADSIRSKAGTSAPIVADAFPAAIDAIPSGGGGDITWDDIAMRTLSGNATGSATTIGSYAFTYCSSLTTASFSACTTISNYAFASCSGLTTVSFPACTTMSSYAFAYCKSLTTASFPACTTIGSNAFVNCSSLTTAIFPACTLINYNAFANCSGLTTVSFPACTTMSYAFVSCKSLTTASFPACTLITSYTFSGCIKLLSLYLLGSSVPILSNTNAFSSTPISNYTTSTGGVHGSIIVQASMLDAFKAATNWSVYSSRFSVWNGVD